MPEKEAGAVPIAADRPDAAAKPGDDAIRMVFHAAALLALVALVAYCIFWAPRGSAVSSGTAAESGVRLTRASFVVGVA